MADLPGGWPATEVSVRLLRGAGSKVRVEGSLCSAPVWFRYEDPILWMVGSGASPVGEDHIRVRVEVGSGVAVSMRSVAAAMVYAASGAGTRWETEIHVADEGRLDWRPEPVILTERARHVAVTTVHAAAGADVTVDEVLVLGRTDESAGSLRSTLDVRVDGAPTLLTSMDTTVPGWCGPGGIDGARVIAQRLCLGADAPAEPGAVGRDGSPVAVLEPASGCRLAVSVGRDVGDARALLDAAAPANKRFMRSKHSGNSSDTRRS